MRHLSGDSPAASAEERRAELRTLLREEAEREWFDEQVAALPSSLVFSVPPQRLADELRQLQMLSDGEVRFGTRYLSDTGTVEFVVATHEDIAPGVFHKLTGGLTSQGLEILSADINTLADRLVLDLFVVRDPDYAGPPPPDRIEQINRR
jgi:[protein-PII] uridylyltransferase